MAKSTEEVVVGADGRIFVAPVGEPSPADSQEEFGANWVDLGYATEDGVTFTDSRTLEEIRAWQSFYPLRRIVTERDASVSFTLRQWNTDNVTLAFGGGAVTEPDPTGSPGEFRYEPPSPDEIDERALAIEWDDGDNRYRLILPKGMVTENVETNVVRTDSANLPITFGITAAEGESAFFLLTNDPAFA